MLALRLPTSWRPNPNYLKPPQQKPRTIAGYRAKVRIFADSTRYVVKTAETRKEYIGALRLRYSIFHREFIGKKSPIGLDRDPFDSEADLIIIIDKHSHKIVGTYRVICSVFSDHFYSASEFAIESLMNREGTKLELSRACIDRHHRNGQVLSMLWRGISLYLKRTRSQYLFGLSSVKHTDPDSVSQIITTLSQHGQLSDEFNPDPQHDFKMPGLDQALACNAGQTDASLIPPLLRLYLRAGASVCPQPAWDRHFQCIDFLTVLPMDSLSDSFVRRYLQ